MAFELTGSLRRRLGSIDGKPRVYVGFSERLIQSYLAVLSTEGLSPAVCVTS
jgi:hypothetical protein